MVGHGTPSSRRALYTASGGRKGGPGGGARGWTPGTGGATGRSEPSRGPQAGAGRALHKSESCSPGLGPYQLRSGPRDKELRGALPGMVSRPIGGQLRPEPCFPSYK